MRRMLCVWFPLWPIQRLRHARPELRESPLILHAPVAGRMETVVCSPQAAKNGARPGMPLAEARAILGAHNTVRFEAHDAEADLRALRRLALGCQCFSPLVAVHAPDSLFLDITGCAPLFGGEQGLAERAAQRLQRLGLAARLASADTAGAAWASAHYSQAKIVVVPSGKHRQALASLPVEALRLTGNSARLLREFGIDRVEHLQRLPRAGLPARFGQEVLDRLDQALGDVPEPITPEIASEPIEASWPFDYPCRDRRALEAVLERLLRQVLAKLEPRQLGIERLLCKLRLVAAEPCQVAIGLLHASASLRYVMELLRLQLDTLRLPGEVTELSLHALRVVPLEFCQGQIFEADAEAERWRQLPQLLEVLSNRLGKDAVLQPRLCADAQPERAHGYEPWLDQTQPRETDGGRNDNRPGCRDKRDACRYDGPPGLLVRPVQLKNEPLPIEVMSVIPGGPPRRFTWQNRSYPIARCWGPERIETGWWRGQDIRRDYYLIETAAGERFWLFRAEDDSWFLHGEFA